jgi:hypothetical protein
MVMSISLIAPDRGRAAGDDLIGGNKQEGFLFVKGLIRLEISPAPRVPFKPLAGQGRLN